MPTSPSVATLLAVTHAVSAVASSASCASGHAAGAASTAPGSQETLINSHSTTFSEARTMTAAHVIDTENSSLQAESCQWLAAASKSQFGTSSAQTRLSTKTGIMSLHLGLCRFSCKVSRPHAAFAATSAMPHHSQFPQGSNASTEASTAHPNG